MKVSSLVGVETLAGEEEGEILFGDAVVGDIDRRRGIVECGLNTRIGGIVWVIDQM